MEVNKPTRELVCVLFPGHVINDDKAIQCLGGIKSISQVYSQPTKKRLGLSYQPENPFIKRVYGDAKRTAGVVLKVKVKKTRTGDEVKREVVSSSVVGRVKLIYKFESMFDFQFLPVHREENGPLKCILDQIVPSGLDDISFMGKPAPVFLPPASFTRSDKPTNYSYTDKRYISKSQNIIPNKDADVHERLRAERGVPVVRFEFNLIGELPSKPHESYIKIKDTKIETVPSWASEFETVKKLFEDRPIWSLNLIRYKTKIRISSLKIIMPCLSFYMKGGPWRMMWVRYGYDPRKDPTARMYQTLDFRLRHQAGVHSMVMTRGQVTHYKKSDCVKFKQRNSYDEPLALEEINEGAVYFRPGMVPAQRQICYMYCDVKIPEVEAILAQEPPPGYLCHQKRGWLPPLTGEICRDHIFRYVKQTLLSNADFKFEEGSSDEDSKSEDDGGDSSSNEPSTSNT